MTVGQRIKKARKEAGLTQKELANRIGAATGTVQQYELGKRQPRIKQLVSIASTLGVSPTSLLLDLDKQIHVKETHEHVKLDFDKILAEFAEDPTQIAISQIYEALEKLNSDGKEEAIKRVEELTEIPRYRQMTDEEMEKLYGKPSSGGRKLIGLTNTNSTHE